MVTLEYIERWEKWIIKTSGTECLYNREKGRAFAMDEIVAFRDPEQARLYLEKHYPTLSERFCYPAGLEDELKDWQKIYERNASTKPDEKPVSIFDLKQATIWGSDE